MRNNRIDEALYGRKYSSISETPTKYVDEIGCACNITQTSSPQVESFINEIDIYFHSLWKHLISTSGGKPFSGNRDFILKGAEYMKNHPMDNSLLPLVERSSPEELQGLAKILIPAVINNSLKVINSSGVPGGQYQMVFGWGVLVSNVPDGKYLPI